MIQIYSVIYRVFGQSKHAFSQVQGFIIGMDVDDVMQQIKKDCLGVEVNMEKDGNLIHEVAEQITIDSVTLVGPLMASTTEAFNFLRTNCIQIPDDFTEFG